MKNILVILFLLFLNSLVLAQTEKQQKSESCLINQYKSSCISIEKTASAIFPKGVRISLREKHTPSCWGGVGDPNTSPIFQTVHIDQFGRIFQENILEETLKPLNQADDSIKIIDNIEQWQHPTKDIFSQYGIVVDKVELYFQQTLPYFYVHSHFLLNNISDKKQKKLFTQLLKANGQWDLFIVTSSGQQHYIKGKKRKLDLSSCPY